jgi:hypothetical protein
MRCFADVVTSSGATPLVSGTPSGYGPADLQSAYNLPSPSSTAGTGETVGIVDAFDDPNAASDLATYRSQFGLKPCTTANGCFSKVNQSGGTSYPASNSSWAQEISLDLDMVSAICPNCHILLVEASSTSDANLAAAVNRAAALGATQISNSYGEPEFSGDVSEQANYNHPGIDVVAAAGDDGYGVSYPAASQYVTAVGGTSLSRASNARGWTESAWSGTGSGCSAYTPKPAWQTDTGCGRRTVADVSADANPSTGVAVYDTSGSGGWLVFGGTSVATPIIASGAALGIGHGGGGPARLGDLDRHRRPHDRVDALAELGEAHVGVAHGRLVRVEADAVHVPRQVGAVRVHAPHEVHLVGHGRRVHECEAPYIHARLRVGALDGASRSHVEVRVLLGVAGLLVPEDGGVLLVPDLVLGHGHLRHRWVR